MTTTDATAAIIAAYLNAGRSPGQTPQPSRPEERTVVVVNLTDGLDDFSSPLSAYNPTDPQWLATQQRCMSDVNKLFQSSRTPRGNGSAIGFISTGTDAQVSGTESQPTYNAEKIKFLFDNTGPKAEQALQAKANAIHGFLKGFAKRAVESAINPKDPEAPAIPLVEALHLVPEQLAREETGINNDLLALPGYIESLKLTKVKMEYLNKATTRLLLQIRIFLTSIQLCIATLAHRLHITDKNGDKGSAKMEQLQGQLKQFKYQETKLATIKKDLKDINFAILQRSTAEPVILVSNLEYIEKEQVQLKEFLSLEAAFLKQKEELAQLLSQVKDVEHIQKACELLSGDLNPALGIAGLSEQLAHLQKAKAALDEKRLVCSEETAPLDYLELKFYANQFNEKIAVYQKALTNLQLKSIQKRLQTARADLTECMNHGEIANSSEALNTLQKTVMQMQTDMEEIDTKSCQDVNTIDQINAASQQIGQLLDSLVLLIQVGTMQTLVGDMYIPKTSIESVRQRLNTSSLLLNDDQKKQIGQMLIQVEADAKARVKTMCKEVRRAVDGFTHRVNDALSGCFTKRSVLVSNKKSIPPTLIQWIKDLEKDKTKIAQCNERMQAYEDAYEKESSAAILCPDASFPEQLVARASTRLTQMTKKFHSFLPTAPSKEAKAPDPDALQQSCLSMLDHIKNADPRIKATMEALKKQTQNGPGEQPGVRSS